MEANIGPPPRSQSLIALQTALLLLLPGKCASYYSSMV